MILDALNDYYLRRAADPDPSRRLPAFGYEMKEIPFILEIAEDGALIDITDTRVLEGKRKIGRQFLVPASVKKTSGLSSNLLWENTEYLLGLPNAQKAAEAKLGGREGSYPARLIEMHAAFRSRLRSLPENVQADPGLNAVQRFLDGAPLDAMTGRQAYPEIAESGPVMSFRLEGDDALVCQREAVRAAIDELSMSGADEAEDEEGEEGERSGPQATMICLVSGDNALPERLHRAIKGVWGAQTSGANLVSFNLDAFNSYGKRQGANAPVSRRTAFQYTTALNHLLERDSKQRLQVGEASTVFWAQRSEDSDLEGWFGDLFGHHDDPDANVQSVKNLYRAIDTGRFGEPQAGRLFFVLGLSPNAARLAVRFWHAQPLAEVALRIREWFEDLRIVKADFDPEFPSLRRVLAAACLPTRDRPQGDIERLPPAIEGDVMRAILSGRPLPSLLRAAVLSRCRADQARKDDGGKPVRHISAVRAALLKTLHNRDRRARPDGWYFKEINVSLDKTNADRPYLQGRLFAVFERMQEAASPDRDLNRTIRDTYFGAAMATPASVFGRLARLNMIHMRDIRRANFGLASFFDRTIGEITSKLDPSNLRMEHVDLRRQGVFALGYYHQRQDFFSRSSGDDTESKSTQTNQGAQE